MVMPGSGACESCGRAPVGQLSGTTGKSAAVLSCKIRTFEDPACYVSPSILYILQGAVMHSPTPSAIAKRPIALATRGLSKRFDRPAVDALDLTVYGGEFYAL